MNVDLLPDRIASKIAVDHETGCWLWTAYTDPDGYGRCWHEGKGHMAHRLVYTLLVGLIPVDREIDHVKKRGCLHRNCVNPAHLEPVTDRENTMRSDSFAAVNARKTHCPAGHEYTPENTYVAASRGLRECRPCGRRRASEYRARQREKAS